MKKLSKEVEQYKYNKDNSKKREYIRKTNTYRYKVNIPKNVRKHQETQRHMVNKSILKFERTPVHQNAIGIIKCFRNISKHQKNWKLSVY